MSTTPRTDESEAQFRATWLHSHDAPKGWLIVTADEMAVIKSELNTAQSTIARLERERDELQGKRTDALNAGLDVLSDMNRIEKERDQLRAENASLRAIFPAILEALGSGGCTPECSVEFLAQIPKEVGLVVRRLTADVVALRAALSKYGMHQCRWGDLPECGCGLREIFNADRPGTPLLAAVGKASEAMRKHMYAVEAAIIELRKTLPAYEPSKAVADVMAEVAAALAALAPFAPKAENAEVSNGHE